MTDTSDAVIVNARVSLRNVDTAVETVRETDPNGHYLFDMVLPGNYTVTVEREGFNRFVQENIVVQTRADVTVNARLGFAHFATPAGLMDAAYLGGVAMPGFDGSTTVAPALQGVPQAVVSNPFPASNPLTLPSGFGLEETASGSRDASKHQSAERTTAACIVHEGLAIRWPHSPFRYTSVASSLSA